MPFLKIVRTERACKAEDRWRTLYMCSQGCVLGVFGFGEGEIRDLIALHYLSIFTAHK